MSKFGIHALVWVSEWTDESIRYAVNRSAEVGYDLIEAVIFDPKEARPEQTARALAWAGIGCVTGMALNPHADISSADPEVAKRGEQFISDAILATRDMGSKLLGGVTHSAMHRYLDAPHPAMREQLVEIYGRLAAQAQAAGVRLGIEAVNRYESNVVNTLDDAVQIIKMVGSEALFVHMDTYHMNIEEHDCADTIIRNKNHIGHVHIGESHRGYLGSGSVDFLAFFRALANIGYNGPIVFEAFSPAVLNRDVANALAAWRSHWRSSEDIARRSLEFMKAQLASAQTSMNARSPIEYRYANT
jgi:D-psicose/D-tagatose/L-ribulose 3-epimerase